MTNRVRMGRAARHVQAAIAEIEKLDRTPGADYPLALTLATAAERLCSAALGVERAAAEAEERRGRGAE